MRDRTLVEVAGLWAEEVTPWDAPPPPAAHRRIWTEPSSPANSSAALQAQAAFHRAQEPLD